MSGLLVGVAAGDITPRRPTPLAGFAHRKNAPYEGIDHPLALKATWFSAGDTHALLVVADVLWWAPEQVDGLRAQIASRWPVAEDHIVLHATHTHSAPQTGRTFTESLGSWDDEWIDLVTSRLFEVAGAAWEARTPATIRRGRGTSKIGVNRRVVLGIEPPESGMADQELVVLRIDAEGSDDPLAILVHHACHPTTAGVTRVSSEFPGVLAERLADTGAMIAYLQGTCGDINPRSFIDRVERTMDDADVVAIGEELAADVRAVLDGPLEDLPVARIEAVRETAWLAMQRVPDREELEAAKDDPGVTGEWARCLLRNPRNLASPLPVEITHLRLGDALGFLAMNAEVTTPYGLAIKEATGGATLPLAYSNGMLGYIITDAQLDQGGYEPGSSTQYFGLPSPFAPGIETSFRAAIDRALAPDKDPAHP